jgi:hypothetical protein
MRFPAAALALGWASFAAAQPPVVVPASPAWVTISTEELRRGYDQLWAMSDLHGDLADMEALLRVAGLVEGSQRWKPDRQRQLLIVVGDCIDGGPDSVGVVLRLQALQAQAAAAGSRLVVLLGNHEVDFLARPRKASRELVASAARAGLDLGSRKPGKGLAESGFGSFLETLPVAAFVGSWLFAHSGYLDAEDDAASLQAYFAKLAAVWPKEDGERYRLLRDARSIVSDHNWWKSRRRREQMQRHLSRLGLNGLVFGHDPDAFRAIGTIALDSSGSLLKLDAGIKDGQSHGMLLRCDVSNLLHGDQSAMIDNGKPTCRGLTPDGSLHDLPIR